MVGLKLMCLPRGANRNRTLGRNAASSDDLVTLAEVEQIFQRFWRSWRESTAKASLYGTPTEPAGGGE